MCSALGFWPPLKEHGAFPGVISVLPCWGRRSALYGGLPSPVRGFGFDCTSGGSSPHGVAVLPSRRVRSPLTRLRQGFRLHQGYGGQGGGQAPLPTSRRGCSMHYKVIQPASAYGLRIGRRGGFDKTEDTRVYVAHAWIVKHIVYAL